MTAAAAFRGQPLLVLVGLLGAWCALRVAVWQPLAGPAFLAVPHLAGLPAPSPRMARPSPDASIAIPDRGAARLALRYVPGTAWPTASVPFVAPTPLPPPIAESGPAAQETERPNPIRMAVGHTLLLAAGLSQMELPPALAAYLQNPAPPPGVPAAAPVLASLPQDAPRYTGSRWSADGWLMLRHDTTTPVVSGRPSYGRSQAGGVVRYRLAPPSAHGPQAYLRASSAVSGPRDEDLAAGLSGRPLPRVPLRIAAEARLSRTDAGTELRPAAIAVTEFPPLELPHRVRAEAYVQGGYVGGRFATAFVDGQGRIERPVARLGGTEVTAGAGVWGGAQKGAARLDIGPTAAVSFRLGETRGRLAADYRFRMAGDADPASGPALTLSAGF